MKRNILLFELKNKNILTSCLKWLAWGNVLYFTVFFFLDIKPVTERKRDEKNEITLGIFYKNFIRRLQIVKIEFEVIKVYYKFQFKTFQFVRFYESMAIVYGSFYVLCFNKFTRVAFSQTVSSTVNATKFHV